MLDEHLPDPQRAAREFSKSLFGGSGKAWRFPIPARTKRRAKFDFRGRPFVWWIDGDKYLRIVSLDKKFIIVYPLGTVDPPVVEVIGSEFSGIDPAEPRPVRLVVPRPTGKIGAWVNELLRWSFDPKHQLLRFEVPQHLF